MFKIKLKKNSDISPPIFLESKLSNKQAKEAAILIEIIDSISNIYGSTIKEENTDIDMAEDIFKKLKQTKALSLDNVKPITLEEYNKWVYDRRDDIGYWED